MVNQTNFYVGIFQVSTGLKFGTFFRGFDLSAPPVGRNKGHEVEVWFTSGEELEVVDEPLCE